MKVHRMSVKQFAKFVFGLQEQAAKNPLQMAYKFTDKYDYICKQCFFLGDDDWIIRRRLSGTERDYIWARHDPGLAAWTVYEGGNVYQYDDSDLEKAVQKDG